MSAYPGSVGFVDQAPGPMAHGWVVDKSDTVPLPAVTRAIYVGADGDVVVQMAGVEAGHPTTFAAVKAGTQINIACTYVMDATTSASVVALW